MGRVKVVLYNVFIAFLLVEVGLAIASRSNWLPMDLPSYSIANIHPFWRDSNPDFGVWHAPNDTHRHVKECFNVLYRTNAHGMRDAERPKRSGGSRVVVLGNAFIEGVGVERENRLTNLLERGTGVPHLNFGTSGDFGLTQSWLLYRSLASEFDHDAVIISVVPDNNIVDDDVSGADTLFDDRYRPYLIGLYPDYEIKYSHADRLDSAQAKQGGQYFELGFREFTHTAKAYAYFGNYLKHVSAQPPLAAPGRSNAENPVASKYYEFSSEAFDRMRYAIERISALALPRPVLLMVIPGRSDYERARIEGAAAPITEQLRLLSQRTGLHFLDLIEAPANRPAPDSLFHRCDDHWSAQGHRMAADEVARWDYYRTVSRN